MGEGLLRQRRNLITTCVLLWLLKYGGVTFTKFSLGGFDVEFGNPDALILTIWIAFAYFLYRYYQYFSSEGTEKLQRVFEAALERQCEPIIKSLVKEKYPTNNDAILYSYAFLRSGGWQYNGHALGGPYEPGTGSIPGNEHFVLGIRRRELWKGILAAVVDTIFRNSVVTDYLLPFVFALFILYYCGAGDWRGSFLLLGVFDA
jgi:hypothetical protein